MSNYIDGFAFPIHNDHIDIYISAAEAIADIWKEHGALGYFEYVSDGSEVEGVRSFPELLQSRKDETIIFGWVMFESREARDLIHKLVSEDTRMAKLIAPIMDPSDMVFEAKRMVCGGFRSLIEK